MQLLPLVGQVSPDGTGIEPPARNLALSPETAVTVGSASVLATPWRSKACKVAEKPEPLALVHPSTAWLAASAPLMANGLSSVTLLGALPAPAKLTPSCFNISRRISVTVTRTDTWSRPRMINELMTLPVTGVPAPEMLSEAAAAPPEGAGALEAP